MTAAAAASLSRSRGVAGVRSTKGLFFIFTLLCLVCLASSLTDKNNLENLKKMVQKFQQELDYGKAQMATTSEIMNYYVSIIEPLRALMKKSTKDLPHDFFMESFKNFMEKTKAYIDGRNEELGEEIEKHEEKLRDTKNLIEILEEQQAEL